MIPVTHKQGRRILFKKIKLYEHVKDNSVHISKEFSNFISLKRKLWIEGSLFPTFNLFSAKL